MRRHITEPDDNQALLKRTCEIVTGVETRLATEADAGAIAAIYNEGIADRVATFETEPRSADDRRQVIRSSAGTYPIVVVEDEGQVVGWASCSQYRPRECYRGVAEFSVYVARARRGRGVGRVAMEALIAEAERAGFWKLLSRVFVENAASRSLLAKLGFVEVGVYRSHAKLDGVWRDVVIVERLIEANLD
jgi:L-amino acid N-acyltransferase YncA